MLDYIKGEIVELTPASVVIETGGLGYIAHISLNTYSALNGLKTCKLFIHESIPQSYLIDPDGVIIAKNLRGANLIKTLSDILK